MAATNEWDALRSWCDGNEEHAENDAHADNDEHAENDAHNTERPTTSNLFDAERFTTQLDDLFARHASPEQVDDFLQQSMIDAENAGDQAGLLSVLNETMGFYRSQERHEDNQWVVQRAIELAVRMGLLGTAAWATTLVNAATAMRAAKHYDQAEDLYNQALDAAKQAYGPTDRNLAALHNNRSMLFMETGSPVQARDELEQALQIMRQCSPNPSTDLDIASTLTNLAQTWQAIATQEDVHEDAQDTTRQPASTPPEEEAQPIAQIKERADASAATGTSAAAQTNTGPQASADFQTSADPQASVPAETTGKAAAGVDENNNAAKNNAVNSANNCAHTPPLRRALEYARQALDIYERSGHGDDGHAAAALIAYANIEVALGQAREAVEPLKHAVRILALNYGEHSPRTQEFRDYVQQIEQLAVQQSRLDSRKPDEQAAAVSGEESAESSNELPNAASDDVESATQTTPPRRAAQTAQTSQGTQGTQETPETQTTQATQVPQTPPVTSAARAFQSVADTSASSQPAASSPLGRLSESSSSQPRERRTGMELAHAFWTEAVKPMIASEFPELLPRVAAGLVGHGSECYGFDDAISEDHDFFARVCLWLTPDDYAQYGSQLQTAYGRCQLAYLQSQHPSPHVSQLRYVREENQEDSNAEPATSPTPTSSHVSQLRYVREENLQGALPDNSLKELKELKSEEELGMVRSIRARGEQRRDGVFSVPRFFESITGLPQAPGAHEPHLWLMLDEPTLAAATNGRVFADPLGLFSKTRQGFLLMPDDVRLSLVSRRLGMAGQAGQANLTRIWAREDAAAAMLCITEFVNAVCSLVFLLNEPIRAGYMPYYKWQFAALRRLSRRPAMVLDDVCADLEELLALASPACGTSNKTARSRVAELVDTICSHVTRALLALGLTSSSHTFLEWQRPYVEEHIGSSDSSLHSIHNTR
ncbi:DUF4037 domain-containing protein [Bifidobacterium gallicum]|nr:DUF4037 domain-containing protein [Bifidobacterium gallicum]KFI59668.1 TPR-repeat-containing protein [Bifidobacterium gallicum DSM 20093 = LMG 11596]